MKACHLSAMAWPQRFCAGLVRWATAAAASLLITGTQASPTAGPTAAPSPSATPDSVLVLDKPVVLLGEVHDHPQQHALRLSALDALLSRGARPALLMEQFDLDQQGAIEHLRATQIDAMAVDDPQGAARVLTRQLGRPGWTWDFYTPFIERALRLRLPIVAANLPRTILRPLMRDGLAAHGFEAAVPEEVLEAQARLIEASHCGMVDRSLARRMALAQVARDQAMARAVEAHAERGVVLLAGNGHVRTDLGIPQWLTAATRSRAQAVGVLELDDPTTAFDLRVVTAPHPRTDPCAGMRQTSPWSNPAR